MNGNRCFFNVVRIKVRLMITSNTNISRICNVLHCQNKKKNQEPIFI